MGRPACNKPGHTLAPRPDGYRYCKTCSRLKAKTRKLSDRKAYFVGRYSTVEGHCKDLWQKVKRRSSEKGFPFDLTPKFLMELWAKQNGSCAITGYPLSLEKGKGRQFTAVSLDRIVPSEGYTETNVRFVCDGVNTMRGSLSDKELETWCKRVVKGLSGNTTLYVPNYNTWADLVDRLIVCTNKLSAFENRKREEQGKANPDKELIAHWDNLSRDECETRNILKREIDTLLKTLVESGFYDVLPDNRTFRAPPKSIADLLAEQCAEIGKSTFEKLNGR